MLFPADAPGGSGTFNARLRQANGRIICVKGTYSRIVEASSADGRLNLLLQDARSLRACLDDQPMMANFKAIMEVTDDFIYFKDRNHVFTGASQTLVSITQPAEHWTDLLGKTDYDVFPEAYADIYYRLEKDVFAGIPVAHEVQEYRRNDGRIGWWTTASIRSVTLAARWSDCSALPATSRPRCWPSGPCEKSVTIAGTFSRRSRRSLSLSMPAVASR